MLLRFSFFCFFFCYSCCCYKKKLSNKIKRSFFVFVHVCMYVCMCVCMFKQEYEKKINFFCLSFLCQQYSKIVVVVVVCESLNLQPLLGMHHSLSSVATISTKNSISTIFKTKIFKIFSLWIFFFRFF